MNDLLSNKKVESRLRNTLINAKILIKDNKKIREDLKEELNRYMESVKAYLDDHLQKIEDSLNSLEIEDLYIFQTGGNK